MTWLRAVLLWIAATAFAVAAETIPPAPPAHFNDYAGVVDSGTASSLDRELAQFERDTSNQIVVAVYPKMQSDSSVEDFTVRTAQSWHAGLKGKDNGAVLFVFVQSHQVYIQVGYGLEGSIPDATAKQIISNEITPAFRAGNYSAGLTAGVHALMAASKNEYHGTGHTFEYSSHSSSSSPFPFLFVGFLVLILISRLVNRRGTVYQNGGRRGISGPWIFPGGGFGGGSSWGGGGGGGGGGFSGGGGSFGGGGAGGSW